MPGITTPRHQDQAFGEQTNVKPSLGLFVTMHDSEQYICTRYVSKSETSNWKH